MDIDHRPNMNSTRRIALAAGAVCVAVILILATLLPGWLDRTPEGGLSFVIPAGAASTVPVPTIDSAIEIPTSIVFEAGEVAVIHIRNEDDVAHRAGPWVIASGQTFSLSFDDPGEYFYLCSVDAAESVTILVR